MEILEFGNRDKRKIILVHGFETPYQIWEKYIEYYKNDYHIIVPILQGHNPNRKEDFVSFEESAEDIENYYISRYGNNVYALYGMSMGGVLVSQLWQNQKLYIRKVILESSPLLSYNGLMTTALITQYLSLTHKAQARDKKIVKQAINTIIPECLINEFLEMIDGISDTTIINYIKQVGKYRLPNNLDSDNTEVYYYHGTKINELLAKKTAKYIGKNYPNSTIICFHGKAHCEDSLMNPNAMIMELNKVLAQKKQI